MSETLQELSRQNEHIDTLRTATNIPDDDFIVDGLFDGIDYEVRGRV